MPYNKWQKKTQTYNEYFINCIEDILNVVQQLINVSFLSSKLYVGCSVFCVIVYWVKSTNI